MTSGTRNVTNGRRSTESSSGEIMESRFSVSFARVGRLAYYKLFSQ